MAIRCPKCRRQYDITLFQYGKTVRCECGETLDARKGHEEPIDPRKKRHEP